MKPASKAAFLTIFGDQGRIDAAITSYILHKQLSNRNSQRHSFGPRLDDVVLCFWSVAAPSDCLAVTKSVASGLPVTAALRLNHKSDIAERERPRGDSQVRRKHSRSGFVLDAFERQRWPKEEKNWKTDLLVFSWTGSAQLNLANAST